MVSTNQKGGEGGGFVAFTLNPKRTGDAHPPYLISLQCTLITSKKGRHQGCIYRRGSHPACDVDGGEVSQHPSQIVYYPPQNFGGETLQQSNTQQPGLVRNQVIISHLQLSIYLPWVLLTLRYHSGSSCSYVYLLCSRDRGCHRSIMRIAIQQEIHEIITKIFKDSMSMVV